MGIQITQPLQMILLARKINLFVCLFAQSTKSRKTHQQNDLQRYKRAIQIRSRLLIPYQHMNIQSKEPGFLNWAYNHNDPAHPKYSTNTHAIYVTITGTFIVQLATWIASHAIFTTDCNLMRSESIPFGYFLLAYLVFMMVSRTLQNGSIAIYQFLWACNQALLLGAFAMIVQDSHLLRTSIVIVSIDQLLWYVDLIGYLFKRKFIIGVAKYIIWPQTTKIRLMTTFHHVWYIPLVIWLTSPSIEQCGLNFQVFFLCCVMSLLLALAGRFSTPKQIIVKGKQFKHSRHDDESKQSESRKVYLNLNLSWQLWKDVRIPFLTKMYQIIPQPLIPVALSLFWDAGSFIGFIILLLIQKLI